MSTLQRRLIRTFAVETADRIAKAAIALLIHSRHRLSGDDSGLSCTWEEICVQVQGEESPYWDAYESAMGDAVRSALFDAPRHALVALWFLTDDGWNWYDEHQEPDDEQGRIQQLEDVPVDEDAIVRYLVQARVLPMAADDDRPAVVGFLRNQYDDRLDQGD